MTCWQVLGIPQTDDKKVIKRSYAKKLKLIDIDNDINGFQSLREAYEYALMSVQYEVESEELPSDFSTITIDEPNADLVAEVETLPKENLPTFQNAQQQVVDFMERVEGLFNDDNRKGDLSEWEPLYNDVVFENLYVKEQLFHVVFSFFSENITEADIINGVVPVPLKVIENFDRLLSWSDDEITLSEHYSEYDIEKMLYLMDCRERNKRKQAVTNTRDLGKLFFIFARVGFAAMVVYHFFDKYA